VSRRAGVVLAQLAAGAIVVWFLARYVLRYWDELRRAPEAIAIHPGPLAAAAAIILGTYALLIVAWDAVVRGWGERLPYRDAARIWCLSNLAKYVPGRVWQIAGMAAMAERAGVSPWAAAGSAIVVQLLNICAGTLVTVLFAPGFGHPLLIAASGLLTAGCAALLTWPAGAAAASRLLNRLTGRGVELRAVRPGPLLLAAAITAVQWVAYGWALHLTVRGLTGHDVDLLTSIGVFTGSYVVGLINVLTSAGLGTREVILVAWLTGPLGPAAAAVVTAGSRILMTATELLAALITLPLATRRTDVQQRA
jgi:hypothetical protein